MARIADDDDDNDGKNGKIVVIVMVNGDGDFDDDDDDNDNSSGYAACGDYDDGVCLFVCLFNLFVLFCVYRRLDVTKLFTELL